MTLGAHCQRITDLYHDKVQIFSELLESVEELARQKLIFPSALYTVSRCVESHTSTLTQICCRPCSRESWITPVIGRSSRWVGSRYPQFVHFLNIHHPLDRLEPCLLAQ